MLRSSSRTRILELTVSTMSRLIGQGHVTHLQLGQLPFCSPALLGGKVACLYGLVQVQLGALKCLV